MCTQNIRFRDSKELFMQRSLLRNNTFALCFDQQHPPGPRRCETIVTVRSRTGLRMQESWFWARTWVHRKTHEKVFRLLTRTLTKFK